MYIHIFSRHLNLILAQSKQTAQSHIGIRDVMLAGRQDFQIVSALQYGAIIRGYIEAELERFELDQIYQTRTHKSATTYSLLSPEPVSLFILTSNPLKIHQV